MTDRELADELRQAETMAKKLGANWEAEARLFRLRSETAFRRGKEADVADYPYVNESSQSERKRVLQNDRRVHSSYLAHAQASIDEDRGGRYAAIESSPRVTGASPISYPQLPETSPANQAAMVGDEPLIDGTGEGTKLGYRIDDMTGSSSTVPVEPTPDGHVEDAGPAAEELDRHVITPSVAGPTSRRGFRRRM